MFTLIDMWSSLTRGQTDRHTHTHRDATGCPTHDGGYAGVGNK